MKQPFKNRQAFLLKSMLWSLLLYTAVMLVFNWDEVSSRISGGYSSHIANSGPATSGEGIHAGNISQPHTSTASSVLTTAYALVQILSGLK